MLSGTAAVAQCGGLTSVVETSPLVYPPIAKAARVQGVVILLASFTSLGEVERISLVNGPPMLQASATSFVRGWRVNAYTGPRTCALVLNYKLTTVDCDEGTRKDVYERIDPQHVTTIGAVMPTCDPSYTITRRRRRFIIF
jgi:TonB family protein